MCGSPPPKWQPTAGLAATVKAHPPLWQCQIGSRPVPRHPTGGHPKGDAKSNTSGQNASYEVCNSASVGVSPLGGLPSKTLDFCPKKIFWRLVR